MSSPARASTPHVAEDLLTVHMHLWWAWWSVAAILPTIAWCAALAQPLHFGQERRQHDDPDHDADIQHHYGHRHGDADPARL